MPPNILLITADDMGGDTPGCFGGPAEVTPTLDRLAAEGMTFGRAHVAIAVCQPSRSANMTGRWPHRNGAQGFEPITAGVPLLTRLLHEAGYMPGILGKVEHLQPVEAFGWEFTRGMRELGMGRDPRAYGEASRRFMGEAAAQGRPWFLMANAHDPHRPYSGSQDELDRFPAEARATYPAPSKVFGPAHEVGDLPGFLPGLPEVAQEYQEYLSSSRRCDDVVAGVLRALDEAGAADDTLVVFLSDNGIAVPFAKANCYLQSSWTPLIVRWPLVTRPGTRVDTAFVSMIDLFPTLCAAAGVPEPTGLDGRSMLPLLRGERQDGWDTVFTVFHETAPGRRCSPPPPATNGSHSVPGSTGTVFRRSSTLSAPIRTRWPTWPRIRAMGRRSRPRGGTCSRGWPRPAIRSSTRTAGSSKTSSSGSCGK
ncbi:sulfatase [Nonomuraea sp. NPDC026600]|uniref:sulfatase family protein n=1 Tax=Nonomuraea sp. NPDC026600 TaxID=3155363 RepID=UPI00340F2663